MTLHESAVVVAADEGFAIGLAVAMHSALRTLDPVCRPSVYVLDNGLSDGSRARVRGIAHRLGRGGDLRFVEINPERFEGVQMPHHLPAASFSRLLIPELVDPGTERVVYLDSDLLVRGDLSPLFRLDLGGAAIAGVRDFLVRSFDPETLALSRQESEYPRPYFNAGVLVIDVAAWLRAGIGEQALGQAAERFLDWGDQDALNLVVDRWHTLDDRWNTQTGAIQLAKRRLVTDRPGYKRERERYKTAAIWHFVGLDGKPWEPRCETLGTVQWALAFRRSGWLTRVAAAKWLVKWSAARATGWPAIAVRRWRARLTAFRRASGRLSLRR